MGSIEVICGTLLIVGLLTRVASLVLLLDISVAILSAKIPNSPPGLQGVSNREPPIYLFMFLLAYFKAASGVALPLVAISNTAFIELQNLPI